MMYLPVSAGWEAMIFSFDKSSLEGGQKKTLGWSGGGFKKIKGKNKEIIIVHPLDKLWMLPNGWWTRKCLSLNKKEEEIVVFFKLNFFRISIDCYIFVRCSLDWSLVSLIIDLLFFFQCGIICVICLPYNFYCDGIGLSR